MGWNLFRKKLSFSSPTMLFNYGGSGACWEIRWALLLFSSTFSSEIDFGLQKIISNMNCICKYNNLFRNEMFWRQGHSLPSSNYERLANLRWPHKTAVKNGLLEGWLITRIPALQGNNNNPWVAMLSHMSIDVASPPPPLLMVFYLFFHFSLFCPGILPSLWFCSRKTGLLEGLFNLGCHQSTIGRLWTKKWRGMC